MNKKLGKFITIEGAEGVGKTTNMAFIKQWLDEKNIKHILSPVVFFTESPLSSDQIV